MVEEFEETKENRAKRVMDAEAGSSKRMPTIGSPLAQCELFEIVVGQLVSHDLSDFGILELGSDPFQSELDRVGMRELYSNARIEGDWEGCDWLGTTGERENETGSTVVFTVGNP